MPSLDVQNERALVGALFWDPGKLWDVRALGVVPEMLSDTLASAVFEAQFQLAKRGDEVTAWGVSDELRGADILAVDVSKLEALATDAVTAAAVMQQAETVLRRHLRDEMAKPLGLALARLERGNDPESVWKDLQDAGVRLPKSLNRPRDFKDCIDEFIDELQSGGRHAWPTGFKSLDRFIGGLSPGDITVIAGRPGMGKSAFATDLARRLVKNDRGVLFVSLEMTASDVASRAVSAEASMSRGQMRESTMRAATIAGELSDRPMLIWETGSLSVEDLVGRVREVQASRKIDVVIIDYLQLMKAPGRLQNVSVAVGELSRCLKTDLAKDCGVAVVALAQLNREVEKRQDQRPRMSDLRESGAIEQDASHVILLYRDAYYEEQRRGPDWKSNYNSDDDGDEKIDPDEMEPLAEAIVAKNRHGPTGIAELTWRPEYQRFDDVADG